MGLLHLHSQIQRTMWSGAGALLPVLLSFASALGGHAQLVPAIITFGDSSVDVGNNNQLLTAFRADYPPYGRDFINHEATGRFCNGKLATDLTSDLLGFSKYPPAYLSPAASGKNLLIGANFASAGSGYDDRTAAASHAIGLSQQLSYFKEYIPKLGAVAGRKKATSILSEALYIVSTGSSDFVQNYYVNPLLKNAYTPDQYSTYLVGVFSNFVKELHSVGARRIGVTSLPPLGCMPGSITLFGLGNNTCVQKVNKDAQGFNKKLEDATVTISKSYPKLKIALLDIYTPFLDLADNPSKSGFAEARRGCCGTGLVETTTLLCNPKSPGTCRNASQYVFWDSVHPSQAANQVLADAIILEGINLVT